jgi:hypothetical protein
MRVSPSPRACCADAMAEPDALSDPHGRMFTPVQMAAASILGSFLAPALLLAINYGLRAPRAAGYAVAGGLLATAAIVLGGVTTSLLPWPAWAAIPFAPTLVIAIALQRSAVGAHRSRGGRRASHRAALGVACASLVLVIIGLGCTRAALQRSKTGATLRVEPRGHLRYDEGISEMEGRWAIDVLQRFRYFEDGIDVEARLVRLDGHHRLLTVFFAQEGIQDDETRAWLRAMAVALSREVFAGAPVDVSVHDGYERERYRIRWGEQE